MSDFLSFHTLNDEIFVKDSSETVQARVFIFDMQVDNDVWYRGIANQPSPAYSSLYLSIFLSLYILSKISPQLYTGRIETSNLVYRFTTTSCIVELKMAFSYLFFPIFVLFSFSLDFSSKISLQPFKIETSNLIYRFTTTSCDVGLKMDILLFPVFFFLSTFFTKDTSHMLWKD